MVSERMLLPNWARTAARVLSDATHPALQRTSSLQVPPAAGEALHVAMPPLRPLHGLSESNRAPDSGIAKSSRESVAGTVSRKGKFGFVCEKCSWVPYKGDPADWIDTGKGGYVGLHFPDRCKKCKSKMKRWTCAARNYDKLEMLRLLEGRHCLRFTTFTREEWNVKIPAGGIDYDPWKNAEALKKPAVKKFNNWRQRNKYWKTREAKGQAYYECTMYPVWNGWGFDEVKLHFHIHTVVCSKRLENKDIQICHGRSCCRDADCLEPIPLSTTMQREWGGVVDVRACKTWKHKDGEMKTSKRFVMNYLVDYINKSPHWQSTKFGDWSC